MARYSDTNGSRNQITQERAESQLTDSLCIIVSGVRCRSSNDVAFSPHDCRTHDRVSNVAIAKIYIHTRFNKNTDKKFLRKERNVIEIRERRFEDSGRISYRNGKRATGDARIAWTGAIFDRATSRALIAAPSGRNYHNSSR